MKRLHRIIRNMSLYKKLLISYIGIAIIPMVVISAFFYTKFVAGNILEARTYANTVAKQIVEDVEEYINKFKRVTYATCSNRELQNMLKYNETYKYAMQLDNREKINNFMLQFINMDTKVNGVYLYTKNKELFYQNNSEKPVDKVNFDQMEWYNSLVEGNVQWVVIPPHIETKYSDFRQRINFSLVRSIKDIYDGSYIGMIYIDVDVSAISDIIGKANLNIMDKIIVEDENKNIIYDSSVTSPIAVQALYEKPSKFIPTPREQKSIIAYTSNYSQWSVILIAPFSKLIKSTIDIGKSNLVMFAVLSIVFIVLAKQIAFSIIKPINRLKHTIKKVENGDFNVKVEVDGEDEISQLSKTFNIMLENINRLIDDVYRTNLLNKEAEFKALQSQINPHFMYNTLETINMMLILKEEYEISDIISSFAGMLRFSTQNSEKIIPLEMELKHVEDYMNILQMRYKDKFILSLEIQENCKKYLVVKLSLQPLIENAILHGLMQKTEGVIILSAYEYRDKLYVEVCDDGIGIAPNKVYKIQQALLEGTNFGESDSIGLDNINKRIKLYFGESYGLQIKSVLGEGTRIEMVLPVVKKKGEVLNV